MSSSSSTPSKKFPYGLCQMRSANGDPCRMPALHSETCCHYHKVMGKTPIIGGDEFLPYQHFYLPRLEDATSIQTAISEVCELMLHRRIEPKEASALFYAMRVASQNLGPQALPPATIQACAQQPRRRGPGRPRKVAPDSAILA